ncbi:hypothetical protein BH09BAC2_BH09BAC2_15340 [soil metagenome]
MKSIFFALALILTVTLATAQKTKSVSAKPVSLSFGANFGAPLGKQTASFFQYELGGDLLVAYHASDKFKITGSAGFDVWHHGKGSNFNYVPLLAGFRFGISNKVFISEQGGYAIGISKDPDLTSNGAKIKGAFTDVAGIGLQTGTNSEVMLGYKGLFYSGITHNLIVLRLGYRFGK